MLVRFVKPYQSFAVGDVREASQDEGAALVAHGIAVEAGHAPEVRRAVAKPANVRHAVAPEQEG